MIRINDLISLDEDELEFSFIRASGPGGQNVNKVSSAAQLRFDVQGSASIPDDIKDKLISLAGARATKEGVIVITADRLRTQERNREDAIDRLVELVKQAAHKPKPRKKTKPTKASKEKRLDSKTRHGRLKARRGGRPDFD